MTGSYLQKEYETIWDNYKNSVFNDVLNRGFVYQFDEDEKDCDILFIGINPAYKEGNTFERKSYIRSEAIKHPYFKPFERIKKKLKSEYGTETEWTHLDLLVFRERHQSYIKKTLFNVPGGLQFIVDQLKVAKNRIETINPKVIVVCNTLARRLMGKEVSDDQQHNVWMGLEFIFDKEKGTDVIVNHNILKGTPVFFTSMLSGQRALDNGSKERLIWHLNKVLMLIENY
jgi:hypothetical protein